MTTAAGAEAPFVLPPELEAHEPPEARGLARDEVRLMASFAGDDAVTHTHFTRFADFLRPGDLVVVNTSATLAAAVPAQGGAGADVVVHFSQRLRDGRWVVELRRPAARGTEPLLTAQRGDVLHLPEGSHIELERPYLVDGRAGEKTRDGVRLWLATVHTSDDVERFLARHGSPIRYGYVTRAWPLPFYQTIFARHRGSAEMPSAGRPFTGRTLHALEQKGVEVATVLLHAGVSSQESHEPPYPELFRVDESTARRVNEARTHGGRVVAVGTTVVRALESAASSDGSVQAARGWTDLVISPARGLVAVDALLTGFHEPNASHLAILEALAGRSHIHSAYAAALREGYQWHEFGDVHLILRGKRIEN